MRKYFVTALFAAACFLCNNTINAQVVVAGPSCVLAGVEYQYNIQSNLPESSRLCVTGGTISGDSSACTSSLNVGFVRVIWSGVQGSLNFTSSEGNFSLQISVTGPLQPGSIDSAAKEQFINYNESPSSISCTMSTGGACAASYSYQWQQSSDKLKWEDISGAINQNLNNISAPGQTRFFRRKTIENVSQTTVYSGAAVVYVSPAVN
jgi:hypothetical protein